MTKRVDVLKSLVKEPKTAEDYAYNICAKYDLPFWVQTSIEHMLNTLLVQNSVQLSVSAKLLESIFYQQKRERHRRESI